MTSWYAIVLKPMATRPSKQDARYSNIEYALNGAGIEHYYPREWKELRHHRTKKPIDKFYPLVPGYAFVWGVSDWLKLRRVDYVANVVCVAGAPHVVRKVDIEGIMAYEEMKLREYEAQKAKRRLEEEMKEKHIPQRRARVLYPAGSTVKINEAHMLLGGRNAIVKEATGRDTIRALVETLNGMVTAELPLAMVSKVA